jgi:hypothetical protein
LGTVASRSSRARPDKASSSGDRAIRVRGFQFDPAKRRKPSARCRCHAAAVTIATSNAPPPGSPPVLGGRAQS